MMPLSYYYCSNDFSWTPLQKTSMTSWTPVTIGFTITVKSQTTGRCRYIHLLLYISLGCSHNPKQIRTTLHNILEGDNKNTWLLKIEIPQRQIRQWKVQTEENFDCGQALWKNNTHSWQPSEVMAVLPKCLWKQNKIVAAYHMVKEK